MRRALVLVCLGILCLALVVAGCGGGKPQTAKQPTEKFPTQPVHIIVQYPPGGGIDVTARLLAKHAEKYLGQNIVIENKVGGNGVLGITTVAAAKPDGYTLGIILNTTATEKHLLQGVNYSVDSFDPIVQINFDPGFLVTKKGSKYDRPLAEVVQMAKEGKLNMGVGAVWTTNDFVKVMLEKDKGVKFERVGFPGGGPVTKALLAGDVDVGTQYANEWFSYYQSGDLVGLGVSSEKRLPGFEKVPTFKEQGINIGNIGVRRVLASPKGTPPERIAVLEQAFLKALNDPACLADFQKAGMSLLPADSKTVRETLKDESKVYVDIVTGLGVKPGDVPK
jgi:tripartite-type tricarboxylate transporter receptor subunit TctC